MKTINAIIKVLTALATIAGAVYIIATYGDKIVEWAKQLLAKAPQPPAEAPAAPVVPEEAAPEEAAPEAAEVAVSEEPAEVAEDAAEAPAELEQNAPVADESDFEG